jgi:hypothetical protein
MTDRLFYQELLSGSFCVTNYCVALLCIKSCHYVSGVSQEPSCVSAVYPAQICGCNIYRKSCMTLLWMRNYCMAVNIACVSFSYVLLSHHHTTRLCLVPTREETLFLPGRSAECARMFASIQASGSSGATVNFFSSQEGRGTSPQAEFWWISLRIYAAVLYPPERLRP